MKKQTQNNAEQLKKALEQELKKLESDLKTVGHKNVDNPKDWEPSSGEIDTEASDPADIADNIESFESNTAVLKQLETRYNEIKLALGKMKKGTYGICEVGNEPIEKERLEANPAARTCMKHKDIVRHL